MNKLAILPISLAFLLACGSTVATIPGTKIVDTPVNRDLLSVAEEYRMAVERKDMPALLLMASQNYWEDGGTPQGGDDYGYEGLRDVLKSRFMKANNIRYSLRYMNIYRRCKPGADPSTNEDCRAYIDVLIDASYSVTDARGGEKRPDKRDQNQLVLEWSRDKWVFLSGM